MSILPRVIQGGMGVAVSDWRLARAVASQGGLGVVSGTALAVLLARRLQLGDLDGQMRRGLGHFPDPAVAQRVLARHWIPGGKDADRPFAALPMPTMRPGAGLEELTVAAAFVEVFLAKEGHDGVVGMNLLEKIQLPTLATLFGALLAGVDCVLMGAGVPRQIPGVLDRLARGERAELSVHVEGALPGETFTTSFDPRRFGVVPSAPLRRPLFLAIVSSDSLARTLARKSSGHVDGFVVEGSTAGGHNAPPRGAPHLSAAGEPVYGPRDLPDFAAFRDLGRPFWLAGSYGRPGRLRDACAEGAEGVQVGTAFAFCDESGVRTCVKADAIRRSRAGALHVRTDPRASPTGFPFKVVDVPGSLSDEAVYAARERTCDLGYLRHPYRRADGSVGYRCPAEPVADYVRKGGAAADAVGRRCLCNGLSAVVGLAQVRPRRAESPDGAATLEPMILTGGDDAAEVWRNAAAGRDSYDTAEVLHRLDPRATADAPHPSEVAAT